MRPAWLSRLQTAEPCGFQKCRPSSSDLAHNFASRIEVLFSVDLGCSQLAVAKHSLGGFQTKPTTDCGCGSVPELIRVPPMR